MDDFVQKNVPMLRLNERRMMLASILPNLSNFDIKMTSNWRPKFGSTEKK